MQTVEQLALVEQSGSAKDAEGREAVEEVVVVQAAMVALVAAMVGRRPAKHRSQPQRAPRETDRLMTLRLLASQRRSGMWQTIRHGLRRRRRPRLCL